MRNLTIGCVSVGSSLELVAFCQGDERVSSFKVNAKRGCSALWELSRKLNGFLFAYCSVDGDIEEVSPLHGEEYVIGAKRRLRKPQFPSLAECGCCFYVVKVHTILERHRCLKTSL
jgi:hypothetical protein